MTEFNLEVNQELLQGVINGASEFAIIATQLDGIITMFSVGAERMLGYSANELVGKATPERFHDLEEVIARSRELSRASGTALEGFDVFVTQASQGLTEVGEWTYVRKDGSRVQVKLVITAIRDRTGTITGYMGVAQDIIRSSGKSLLGVLNDVLDFSKIEAGHMELAHEPFDLEEVLEGMANLMSINVGAKDIEPAIAIDPGLPRHYVGDGMRLNQILTNLVGNAIKFTQQGEVVLQVKRFQQRGHLAGLEFRVRDTGIGMDEAQQGRVFEAFTQVDTSITRRFGGSGLGLVICKRLIELMDGSLQMQSSEGKGTEFWFRVELEVAPDLPESVSQRPHRLLVVDANASSRDSLSSLIRHLGWEVLTEPDCDAAGRRLKQARETPVDAILVDWKLPGLDRLLAVTKISLPQPRRILLVSAHGREQLTDAARWDAVMVKPLTASRLFDLLQKEAPTPAVTNSQGQLQGVRILLVEDNETNQAVACGLLEQAGAEVDVVSDGSQAVTQLQLAPERYQLVLMDVQMPVMDGFTATDIIRRELKLTLPIIAMSAGVRLEEQAQCLASGMDGFIAKPVDFQRMLDTLLQHLQADVTAPHPVPVSAGVGSALFAPDKLLAMVRGKPRRLGEILDMIDRFIERGMEPLQEGRNLLAQHKISEAARLFHTLKGSMGNLGAEQVWAAAQKLEYSIRAGDKDNWEELVGHMESCLQATLKAAHAWREAHPECWREVAEETAPTALDGAVLEQFRQHLQEQDLQACDDFQQLLPALRAQLSSQKVQELQSAIQALDFQKALHVLKVFILRSHA